MQQPRTPPWLHYSTRPDDASPGPGSGAAGIPDVNHRLVHDGGYGLALDAAGEPVFTNPQGRVIQAGPDTRFRGNVFALTAANRREGAVIGARTLLPRWRGERMDDAMAVDGLIRRE